MGPARSDNTPPDKGTGCYFLVKSTVQLPSTFSSCRGNIHPSQTKESKTAWNYPDNGEKSVRSPLSDGQRRIPPAPLTCTNTDNIPRQALSGQDIPS